MPSLFCELTIIAVFPSALIAPAPPESDKLPPCCSLGYFVAVTVNLAIVLTVPPAVVSNTVPVVAPGITMATTLFAELEINMAATPPMLIAVVLLKLVPVMVTNLPTAPVVGAKEAMLGCCALAVTAHRQKRASVIVCI
jgi:hypothetical protein